MFDNHLTIKHIPYFVYIPKREFQSFILSLAHSFILSFIH